MVMNFYYNSNIRIEVYIRHIELLSKMNLYQF